MSARAVQITSLRDIMSLPEFTRKLGENFAPKPEELHHLVERSTAIPFGTVMTSLVAGAVAKCGGEMLRDCTETDIKAFLIVYRRIACGESDVRGFTLAFQEHLGSLFSSRLSREIKP